VKAILPAGLPQPALVIGIGDMGGATCDELVQRQAIRDAFGSPVPGPAPAILTTVYLSGTSWLSTESAVYVRGDFLEPISLARAAEQIQEAFNTVRLHANQPTSERVHPLIIVVAACSEPAGAALVWPIAALIRCALDDDSSYDMVGVFTTGYRPTTLRGAEWGDANSFATLVEGDALRLTPPLWWAAIQVRYPQFSQQETPPTYDRVLLVDTLKANNTTVQLAEAGHRATDAKLASGLAEVRTHTCLLLEALILGSLAKLLDQDEDYVSESQQVYTGAGASSLTVPLHHIFARVVDYTVATLLEDQIFTIPNALMHDARMSGEELAAATNRELMQSCYSALANWIPGAASRGVALPSGGTLNYEVLVDNAKERLLPSIQSVHIQGRSPFAGDTSPSFVDALAHVNEEIESRAQLDAWLSQQLAKALLGEGVLQAARRRYAEKLGDLLGQGDAGLTQGVELLSAAMGSLRTHINDLDNVIEAGKLDLDRQDQRVRGVERQIYNRRVVRPIMNAGPRTAAILIRCTLLLLLLYQFYWDGLVNHIRYWPLDSLNLLIVIDPTQTGSLNPMLLAAVLLPVLALAAGLTIVPALARHALLAPHRRTLALLVRAGLNQIILRQGREHLVAIVSDLNIQLRALLELKQQIQERTHNESTVTASTFDPIAYLEYSAVKPEDIADPYRRQAAQIVRAQHGPNLIGSWLASRSMLELRPAEEIIDGLHTLAGQALSDLVVKPINTYLNREDLPNWFRRLWQSSVPWIKLDGQSTAGREFTEMAVLLLPADARNGWAPVVRTEVDHCRFFDWPDDYRIALVRLIGGVRAGDLGRWRQLQFAFQMQPADRRVLITNNGNLFAEYPPVGGRISYIDGEAATTRSRPRATAGATSGPLPARSMPAPTPTVVPPTDPTARPLHGTSQVSWPTSAATTTPPLGEAETPLRTTKETTRVGDAPAPAAGPPTWTTTPTGNESGAGSRATSLGGAQASRGPAERSQPDLVTVDEQETPLSDRSTTNN
jgi:hypothetical protein